MQTVIFHPEARQEMRIAANYYDDSRQGSWRNFQRSDHVRHAEDGLDHAGISEHESGHAGCSQSSNFDISFQHVAVHRRMQGAISQGLRRLIIARLSRGVSSVSGIVIRLGNGLILEQPGGAIEVRLGFGERRLRLGHAITVFGVLHAPQHRSLFDEVAFLHIAPAAIRAGHLKNSVDVAAGFERQIDLHIRLDVGGIAQAVFARRVRHRPDCHRCRLGNMLLMLAASGDQNQGNGRNAKWVGNS